MYRLVLLFLLIVIIVYCYYFYFYSQEVTVIIICFEFSTYIEWALELLTQIPKIFNFRSRKPDWYIYVAADYIFYFYGNNHGSPTDCSDNDVLSGVFCDCLNKVSENSQQKKDSRCKCAGIFLSLAQKPDWMIFSVFDPCWDVNNAPEFMKRHFVKHAVGSVEWCVSSYMKLYGKWGNKINIRGFCWW